jgi:copper chaperone
MRKEITMVTVTYSIPNISCGHCVHTIQTEVSELEGVKSVVANQESKQATIAFENPATEEKIKQLLASIDYPAAN